MLSLAEQDAINLDVDVRTYCPEYPQKEWVVTSRLLLGHLAGVRHYKNADEARSTKHFFDLKSALSTFADDPLIHRPGTKYRYSSFGYNLLGSVAEGAGEASFVELLQQRVLAPAGMTSTVVDSVALLIMASSFFGGVRLTVDFDDKLNRDATEIGGVRGDGVFAAELLAAAAAVSNHLPRILGEFVGGRPLPAREFDRVGRARASAFASTVTFHRVSPPHPQPLSPDRNASTTCVPVGGEGSQNQKVGRCQLGRWYAISRLDHSAESVAVTSIKGLIRSALACSGSVELLVARDR